MLGAVEVLVLALLVGALYALLTPLRRRLERWIARRLGTRPATRGRVVVLPRRADGSYGRDDRERHDG